MPTGLIIIILGVASVAGAAVGPFVFYAGLGVILRLAIPFLLHQ